MIKIDKVATMGWEQAVRSMRNPLNSWSRSDSALCKRDADDCKVSAVCDCPRTDEYNEDYYCIGKHDFDLMKRLGNAGTDHAKYRRMIIVYADLVAPLYWWKEYDTYKVGTVANSCSTMHKIQAKEFVLDDFSHENLDYSSKCMLKDIVSVLNKNRELFINTKDKQYWWNMIQLLPSSYNQKRTVMLNYEVLRNMYYARRSHKLDEWREFCKWVESLPYSELITGGC